MKKIKDFYKNNRLFSILLIILIICIFLICFILIKCFYIGNGKSKYGDRLENISNVDISTKKIKKIEEEIKKDKLVESVIIKKTGRIMYIDITFDVKTELIEAQSIAQKSIENFTKEQLKYFDLNNLPANLFLGTKGNIELYLKNKFYDKKVNYDYRCQ